MPPQNILLIMSDEHRPDALGCAGHHHVATPAIDSLASEGTRFSNAYCPSPLCAPSRASFATGKYVHEIGNWDNAAPYNGAPRSWGHYFSEKGVDVTTIGKLDFKPDVDDGFSDQRLADHRNKPDVNGLHRDPPIIREDARDRILAAGTTKADHKGWYVEREKDVTDEAISFLEEHADDQSQSKNESEKPWVLWANYILPHFPLKAEPRYYEPYFESELDYPIDYPPNDNHPILNELRTHFDGEDVDAQTIKQTRAAYYGLCTALDDQLDRLLSALSRLGLAEDTLVIYTSDHGEPLGDHGIWWKCCMYEPSVGVPLILRGPNIRHNSLRDQPVSLLDLIPTMADATGIEPDPGWRGRSLLPGARGVQGTGPDRAIFSEYHAHGVSHGMFMIRKGRYKYIYYPNNPDQLFDLQTDSAELTNLAENPSFATVRNELDARLREIVNPKAIDRFAKADQRERLSRLESS